MKKKDFQTELLGYLIDEENIDYNSYCTHTTKYQTWLDKLCTFCGLPTLVILTIINIILFLLGYLLSYLINFHTEYIKTIPIYFAFIEIYLAGAMIRYSNSMIHRSFEDLRPCFLISDNIYFSFIDHWFSKASNNKSNIYTTLLVFLFLTVIVIFVYWFPQYITNFNLFSLKPTLLKNLNWYNGPYLGIKALILIMYAFFASLFLATSVRLLIISILLIVNLAKISVIPIPNIIKIRLERLSNLYLFISVTWFLGIAIISFLFFDNLDLISICVISFLGILGVLVFVIPQIIYRNLMAKSVHLNSQWVLSSFYKNFNIKLSEREYIDLSKSNVIEKLTAFEDLGSFNDASTHSDHWVYNPTEIVLFLGSQAVAYIAVYIKHFF